MGNFTNKAGLPLPPFGQILIAYQQCSIALKSPIYIYVGKEASKYAFRDIRNGSLCSFISSMSELSQYHWPIKDQKVVVIDTGETSEQHLKKIAASLFSFLPKCLFIYSKDHPNKLICSPRSDHGQQ